MYNVLVGDDEKDIVSALQIYLKSEGYQVFLAYNGKEALKIINREDIQLVLMDIMMPEMNGYETTKAIRNLSNRPDGKEIPIIAMTANAFEEDKRDAIAAGMNGHIAKPIQVDKLLSILSEVIRKQSLYRLKNGTMGKTDDVFADNVIY